MCIAAISTAQGAGGIGVIRISGEDSFRVADRVFRSVSGKKICEMNGYSASYGGVYYKDELIDRVVALVFKAPHSYTGENVVEFSCHGGVYITKAVLRAVLDNGAEIAGPGEFTKRAFLNGKLGLIEAEAVMDIISANNHTAAAAASACLEGALRKNIDEIRNSLINSAAHLSAWADYPEEDIPEITNSSLKSTVDDCIYKLDKLISDCDKGKIIKEGIDTVIVGKPNAGKSTLMNFLSGFERSIVTDIPGTTRDIVEETVSVGDFVLRISDTAGIRDTDDAIEQIGVQKALSRIKSCNLIIAVFDSSVPLDENDFSIIENIEKFNLPCIAVVNKTDLQCSADTEYLKSKFKHIIFSSAKYSQGIDELNSALSEIFDTHAFNPYEGVLAGERQRSAAVNALRSLKEAQESLNMGFTLDAVTVAIEFAVQELLELTGERASERIVDAVFSKFCVGK